MKSSKEIRQDFLEFFITKGHHQVNSAPVIPIDDPTLLFTNAGMNQFKDIFLGRIIPEFGRAVDSQKCIRAGGKHNDLDEVGRDGYHHTFFEMLGNWSFGDYYKKEAIVWAWELLTDVWKLPKDKLYATVHNSDENAYNIWRDKTDIDNSHIEYHGDKDNFWEMGETGPCGPSSEIHIDLGEEFCNLQGVDGHECRVNGNCHRYIELWNLVFIQYNRDSDGELHPLQNKYIDTGAGLERICQVLQGVKSNYDTDLFMPIIKEIEKISGIAYDQGEAGVPHRVIADHIRCLSFAIADGGTPSNEGRGYVLRRILRRAAHHGRLLNLKKPFLAELVDVVIKNLGHHYQELRDKKAFVKMMIKSEEERFNLTLDKGLIRFEEIRKQMESNGVKEISGSDVFMLYDTYGFPPDLTMLMAERYQLTLDKEGFIDEMQRQKDRARASAKFTLDNSDPRIIELLKQPATRFIGYENLTTECKLLDFYLDEGKVIFVMDETPFYAESGGQVADTGFIHGNDFEIRVVDVQKDNDLFIHQGILTKGMPQKGEVLATIDPDRRLKIMRNHSAAHLLQAALREVLGEHIQQKGSYVNSEHLRFDFAHIQQTSPRELAMVEAIINEKIRACLPITKAVMNITAAREEGALALFGEKYGDIVRVVSMGEFSKELCGGTHLDSTGQIGYFKIISESSIAAGVRRIEAVTGDNAEKLINQADDILSEAGRLLHSSTADLTDRIMKLIEENKQHQKTIETLQQKAASGQLDDLITRAETIKGIKCVISRIKVKSSKDMPVLGDQMRDKLKSGIAVLIAEVDGKVSILSVVSADLTKKYQAGKIVKQVAIEVGGKGGGRPDMAQAGGKEAGKIDQALQKARELIAAI
ncbi:MAG: alanine--tRNA ligase [Candidatus Cloacimonetes bacterium]|nr:alanine--tRNA ligase [Candidatus Cloacimonadota bacterium]